MIIYIYVCVCVCACAAVCQYVASISGHAHLKLGLVRQRHLPFGTWAASHAGRASSHGVVLYCGGASESRVYPYLELRSRLQMGIYV